MPFSNQKERSPVSLTKEKILSNLQTNHQQLKAVLTSPALASYHLGRWSKNDVIAHFVGWNVVSLQAIQALQHGQIPEYFLHEKGDDWESYNNQLITKYNTPGKTEQDLLTELEESFLRLREESTTVSEHAYSIAHPGIQRKNKAWTIAEELSDLANHTQSHIQSMQEWISNNS